MRSVIEGLDLTTAVEWKRETSAVLLVIADEDVNKVLSIRIFLRPNAPRGTTNERTHAERICGAEVRHNIPS